MGHRKQIPDLPEPDIRNVAKKLVKVEKPCVAELSTLMDCMKVRQLVGVHGPLHPPSLASRAPPQRSASTTDVDTGCSSERAALQACAQKMVRGRDEPSHAVMRNSIVKHGCVTCMCFMHTGTHASPGP